MAFALAAGAMGADVGSAVAGDAVWFDDATAVVAATSDAGVDDAAHAKSPIEKTKMDATRESEAIDRDMVSPSRFSFCVLHE